MSSCSLLGLDVLCDHGAACGTFPKPDKAPRVKDDMDSHVKDDIDIELAPRMKGC